MLTYHKLEVKVSPSKRLPLAFIGSTLRGAFGVSLKKVVCINPSFFCEGCFAKDNCLYYDFYEEKNRAHQYRFDITLNPKEYSFNLYLFEQATRKLPYILSAVHMMFTRQGIGVNREKLPISSIMCDDKIVYKDERFDLKEIKPQTFKIEEIPQKLTLFFKTPLRMKYQNRLLKQKPPLESLLYSIQNRLSEIKDLPKTKLSFEPRYREKRAQVRFLDQTRRSNRQKTKLQIGGIVGEIEYERIDEKSVILLKLGEILGVGKQTVFGMGKIAVKDLKTTNGVASNV